MQLKRLTGSAYQGWIERAITLRDAFFLSVTMIHPKLPKWFLRIAVLQDVNVIATDDLGDFRIHRMNPFNILRKKGFKFFLRWLAVPLVRWAKCFASIPVVYRWLIQRRASESAGKRMLKSVAVAHAGFLKNTNTNVKQPDRHGKINLLPTSANPATP